MTRPRAFLNLLIAIAFSASLVSNAQHRTADAEFTMALTGDSIITRKLSVYDEAEYLQMIELIRSADVAFTNLEVLFHDYEAYPMAESGGTWMRADPSLANDLAWAGFDMVARANNHSGDYGVLGMDLTTRHVAEAGIVQAGVGASLAEAREAKFLETPRARVALISIASSFANHMRAGRSRDNVPPRPGLNPLRYETTYVMPQAEFESLRETGESLGQFIDMDGNSRGTDDDKPGEMEAFGRNFAIGQEHVIRMQANQDDVSEISAVVNNASRLADFTIVTIHAHEYDGRRDKSPEFLHLFARAMIEAGADVFVGHGPHVLRGIEIYQGKPILYSLGNFIFQNETLLRLPYDNYADFDLDDNSHVADFNRERYENDTKGFPVLQENWESVIAVPTFSGGKLTQLALYPIDLAYGAPPQVRGRPLLARREIADRIIAYLQHLSNPYGTRIENRRGIGYVDLSAAD
ncbi:MAG: CapA family protein [Woeseiaceae bacterium]|nr:CapA family protein [Woeseiaceae bacterium]